MLNKKNISIIVAVVAIILLFSVLNQRGNSTSTTNEFGFSSIDPIEFNQLIENNSEAFLLDVHIPEQEHIAGTDAFIPYNEIAQNTDQLPDDKNTQILVYCRSGSMSREAAYELSKMGYTNIVELAGGINAYREANVSVDISPETYDFEDVIYGDVVTTEFVLTNFTPVELNITRVSTSCSCTSAEVEKETLAPYESTNIKVSFDPAVHKDDTDVGELTRTIFIDTDNPNFQQITSTITANVIKK